MQPKPTKTLEAILRIAEGHHQHILKLLQKLPPDHKEQVCLLDLEVRARETIETLKGQIAVRKGV